MSPPAGKMAVEFYINLQSNRQLVETVSKISSKSCIAVWLHCSCHAAQARDAELSQTHFTKPSVQVAAPDCLFDHIEKSKWIQNILMILRL